MLIFCSRNFSDYNQYWKQCCAAKYFLWKPWYILLFGILWWTESSKEQHLFETEIFCNITNVFIVTFDQFNAFLLNKSINFLLTPNFWMVSDMISTVKWMCFPRTAFWSSIYKCSAIINPLSPLLLSSVFCPTIYMFHTCRCRPEQAQVFSSCTSYPLWMCSPPPIVLIYLTCRHFYVNCWCL